MTETDGNYFKNNEGRPFRNDILSKKNLSEIKGVITLILWGHTLGKLCEICLGF